MELRVMSGLPKQITDYQLECAMHWLELIGDEEAIIELLSMRIDYDAYKLYSTGEAK